MFSFLESCETIGLSMATIVWNTKDDMTSDTKRDLLHTTLEATVMAWADTALLADANLSEMVVEARSNTVLDTTSPKRPCKAHCALMGVIACFAHYDSRCDVVAVIAVIQRLLWCLIVLNKQGFFYRALSPIYRALLCKYRSALFPTKRPYNCANVLHISTEEPYVSGKEPYTT